MAGGDQEKVPAGAALAVDLVIGSVARRLGGAPQEHPLARREGRHRPRAGDEGDDLVGVPCGVGHDPVQTDYPRPRRWGQPRQLQARGWDREKWPISASMITPLAVRIW